MILDPFDSVLWWYQGKTENELRRIDGLLVAALIYIVWFVVVP